MATQRGDAQQARRRVLGLAAGGSAVVAGALLSGGGLPRPAAAESGQHLEGSWQVTITPNGQPQQAGLATFTPDGGLVASQAPVQPGPPGSGISQLFSTPGHGEWVRTGERMFAYQFVVLNFDQDGHFVGTATVHGPLVLDSSGETWEASFRLDVTDPTGQLLQSGTGTATAERIRVPQ